MNLINEIWCFSGLWSFMVCHLIPSTHCEGMNLYSHFSVDFLENLGRSWTKPNKTLALAPKFLKKVRDRHFGKKF